MRTAIRLGALVALVAMAAACTQSGGDARVSTGETVDAGATATRSESVAAVNAACTEFYRFEPLDPGPQPTVDDLRAFARGRITAIGAALRQVDAVPLRPRDRHLSELSRNNFAAALDVYRQLLAAPDSTPREEIDRLSDTGQRRVIEVAVAMVDYGATSCVPQVLERPAPAGAGAGPLVRRPPDRVVRVGDPLVDDKSVVADRNSVWVGLGREPSVVRIDPVTDRIVARIAMPSTITWPIRLVDGDVWVPTETQLLRIDGTTNAIDRRFELDGLGPPDSCFTVAGRWLWVCDRDVLHRVDIRTGRRGADVALPGGAQALTSAEDHLTVAHQVGDARSRSFAVARLDPASGRIGPSMVSPVGSSWGMTEAKDGRIFLDSGGRIVELDLERSRVVHSIDRAGLPGNQMALVGGTLWVTRPDEQRLVRYDLEAGSLSEVRAGPGVNGIAYGHGAVWAANSDAGTVSRFRAGASGRAA